MRSGTCLSNFGKQNLSISSTRKDSQKCYFRRFLVLFFSLGALVRLELIAGHLILTELESFGVFKRKARFHLEKSFIAVRLLEKRSRALFGFIRNVINRENGFHECE